MPIEDAAGGPTPREEASLECGAKRALLIVEVIDDDAPQRNTPLHDCSLSVGLGMDRSKVVHVGQDGMFIVYFDNHDLQEIQTLGASFQHRILGAVACRMGKPTANGETETRFIYRATANVTKKWALSVQVHDMRPPALELASVALKNVPLIFQWQGEAALFSTRPDGAAFDCADMEIGIKYVCTPVVAGAKPEIAAVHITCEPPDALTYSTSGDSVAMEVSKPLSRVELKIDLAFEKILIVGEGTNFQYALPLAEKFCFQNKYKKRLPDIDAILEKQTPRHWVFATQYDVDPEPGAMPDNLFIHPNPKLSAEKRQFDVTNPAHWKTLGDLHGRDFQDAIFNNPHPGYGLHACEVMGVHPDIQIRYRYISVHTIGSDQLVNAGQITPMLRGHWHDPIRQRTVVQQQLMIQCDGTDTLGDYAHGNRVARSIDSIFQSSQFNVAFADRNSHYNARGYIAPLTNDWTEASTMGLKLHILSKYVELGKSVLKPGGHLRIHGSEQIAEDLEQLLGEFGFERLGSWHNGDYFVDYQSNFTHAQQHPSWFAKENFLPGEPNINLARIFAIPRS